MESGSRTLGMESGSRTLGMESGNGTTFTHKYTLLEDIHIRT